MYIKRYIILTIVLLIPLVILDCDDSGVMETNEGYKINGTIINPAPNGKILKAFVTDSMGINDFLADSVRISSDGSFSLSLKNPPDNLLWMIYSINDSFCVNNLHINPAGSKFAAVYFNVFDSLNNNIGGIAKTNYDSIPTQGSFIIDYIYCKTAVTVTGSQNCFFGLDSLIVNTNINNSTGWNVQSSLFSRYMLHNIMINVSSTELSGGSWRFTPIPGFDRKSKK
jgi:hypothetical protein